MIKSKKLSSLVAASLILAGGSLLGVQTVSAEVTDQQFNEVVQGVNANTQKISQIETQVNASKDYSSDIATNKDKIAANEKAIADEATARDQAVAQERAERKGADAAQDKVIQQVADIVHHHCLCFLCYLKRIRIPAPIPVKEYALGQQLLQIPACRCFSHTHRPADQV